MLRIHASTAAAQAKTYFAQADYYLEGQELPGLWHGRGAERLGLAGTIDAADWAALCDNTHPDTGDTLTVRQKANRRVGYDFTFSAPKSVSLLYGLTGDERLLDAFRESVAETMAEVEAEMQARVRKNGRDEDRTTGNLIWGEWVHFTSRPVDGLPDPQLHCHAYTFNTTFDAAEQRWKAGQFGDLKRDAPYFQAKFDVRLGRKLADLGLAVERSREGWQLAGVGAETVVRFSRRTRQIEAEAEWKGITDPVLKSELGARTRARKAKELTLPELRREWAARLAEGEADDLRRLAERIGGERIGEKADAARAAVRNAAEHCFERRSVLPERTLLAESLKRAVGVAGVETVEAAFRQEPFLVKERQGRRMATTPAVLAEERRMVAYARSGRGTCRPLGDGPHEFARTWLGADQKAAVEHVLQSRDRVIVVRGVAGVGKTSMLQETAEAIRANGKRVFACAPGAKAARGVLREKGFDDADTLARLLADEQLQHSLHGQVIWCDEAGPVGTRTMAKLFDLADRLDARVVLSGDRFQHGSVERGSALRLLEEEAGLVPATIKTIRRHSGEYKQAVQALSEGRTADGFRHLDALGWVREVPEAERYQALAADYVDAVAAGESALVVSPTHREGERVTQEIRRRLKSAGRLGDEEQRLAVLCDAGLTEAERADPVNLRPEDVLVYHQNAKGRRKGERVTVGEGPPPTDQAARYQVFHPDTLPVAAGDMLRVTKNGKSLDGGRLNNGDLLSVAGFDAAGNLRTDRGVTIPRDFGHLAYGYVATSHASQGTDVDRVLVGQSARELSGEFAGAVLCQRQPRSDAGGDLH